MLIAQDLMIIQLLEAGMMICFGVSWPVLIHKTIRTRRVEGQSMGFLLLILVGYLSGIAAKFIAAAHEHNSPNWVTLLYAANTLMVLVEIFLYLKFRPRPSDQ